MRRSPFSLLCLVTVAASLGISVPAHSNPLLVDRLEASVNSTLILLSDVVRFRETLGLRQQLDPLFAGTTLASEGKAATQKDVIDFMIQEALINQQFPITDAEVEQEINTIQASNHIDRSMLRSALKDQGYHFDDYFELIRSSVAKRNLIDRDIRTKVTVSEDDVKNYFFNHYTTKNTTPLKYHTKIIVVSPKNYKSTAAARDTALRALKQVQAGESFEEVARNVSDDASASSGGDLGPLSEDQMSKTIRTELKRLKIGQISGVLGGTDTGYFILKLTDVESGEKDKYERVKEEIRGQLAASEYRHQIQLWLERQRQRAFIHLSGEPTVAGLPAAH